MMTQRTTRLASIGLLVLGLSGLDCKRDGYEPPEAPAMPAEWKQVQDDVADRNKLGEFEYRLEGKMKAVRMTLYLVQGKRIQLNTIVPRDDTEADKIYRILANKRPNRTYVRKTDVLYELIGSSDNMAEVEKGYELLAK